MLFFRTPQIFNPHTLVNRSQLHNRPTYISNQLDPYQSYLPPVTYSPPAAASAASQSSAAQSTAAGVQGNLHQHQQKQQQQLNVISAVQQSSHCSSDASSISIKPSLLVNDRSQPQTPQLHSHQQIVFKKEKIEGKVQSSSSTLSSSNGNNTAITANGKTVGFKVPSGKEGSLKHRILTRPYGEKEIRINKTAIQGSLVR